MIDSWMLYTLLIGGFALGSFMICFLFPGHGIVEKNNYRHIRSAWGIVSLFLIVWGFLCYYFKGQQGIILFLIGCCPPITANIIVLGSLAWAWVKNALRQV